MDMPGDIDYAGMSYGVAAAARGNTKAVSLVTSFDPGKGDVLERAIALARMTIDEQEQTLITGHMKRARERLCWGSGVARAAVTICSVGGIVAALFRRDSLQAGGCARSADAAAGDGHHALARRSSSENTCFNTGTRASRTS